MSSMLDFIGAAVLFGVLMLTIGRVQTNLNDARYQSTFNLQTQWVAVELARQIEFDFVKIGYHVKNEKRIITATSNNLKYKADIANINTPETIEYLADSTNHIPGTPNPKIYYLTRKNNSKTANQNFGLVRFALSYYDTAEVLVPPPITDSLKLASIRSISVSFRVESGDRALGGTDTTFYAVNWQKVIYPRNLNY